MVTDLPFHSLKSETTFLQKGDGFFMMVKQKTLCAGWVTHHSGVINRQTGFFH